MKTNSTSRSASNWLQKWPMRDLAPNKTSLATLALVAALAISARANPQGGASSIRQSTIPFHAMAPASSYMIDDGTAENSIGVLDGGDLIALNEFAVVPGSETITSVSIAWGYPASPDPSLNGLPYTVAVWSDPDGDGDPMDAVLLTTSPEMISMASTDTFITTPITPTTITTPNFFIGFLIPRLASGQFAASEDTTRPMFSNRSYYADSASGTGNIEDLNENDTPVAPIESFGSQFRCNWLIRADRGVNANTCVPPPAGLVSWWSGDGNPEDLYDLNDLTAHNGATFGPGKVSKALSLDGVDDYFTVADNGSLNPGTNDFTYEFWLKTTDITFGYILEKRVGCGGGSFYSVHVQDTGVIAVELDDSSGTNYNVIISTIPVNDGAWHHVALVRQGATGTVYIDGVANVSSTTTGTTNISNDRPLTIGQGVCRRPFSGKIDELTYYQSALSTSTIAAIYSAGSAGKCKPTIFVQKIDPTWTPIGNLKNVTNTTTVVDANGFPVNYATVVIKVTDPTGTRTGYTSTTNESGQATFSFLTSQSGTFNFAIKHIFKTGITYDASMNVQSFASLVLP